jgi:hypothetical protein
MTDTIRPPSLDATRIKMLPATAEFRHGFLGSKKGKRGEWRSVEWRSYSASSFPDFPLSVFPTLRAAFPCAFNKGGRESRERQTGRAGLRLGEPRVRWRRGCGQEVTMVNQHAWHGSSRDRSLALETKTSKVGVASTEKCVHVA